MCVCVLERYRDTEIEAGREKQKETDQGVRAVWACLSVSLHMTLYDSLLACETSQHMIVSDGVYVFVTSCVILCLWEGVCVCDIFVCDWVSASMSPCG